MDNRGQLLMLIGLLYSSINFRSATFERAQLSRHGAGEGFDLTCAQRQPVVGHGSGDRRRALDDIETVHGSLPCAYPSLGDEVAGVTHTAGHVEQEVRVEG